MDEKGLLASFGHLVGEGVARDVAEQRIELGGEVRDVAALFVDLIGYSRLAATEDPRHVLSMLNGFFSVVVAVVDRYGGWVKQFVGDEALCLFGAPALIRDPARAATEAALALRGGLSMLDDIDAGIGVDAGPMVVGYVGTVNRYEFAVVGDAINEAARLTEFAKRRPERIAVRAGLVADDERWHHVGEVQLRGRTAATDISVARKSASSQPL